MKTRLTDCTIDTDRDAVLFKTDSMTYRVHAGQNRQTFYGVRHTSGQTTPKDLTGPFSGDVLADRLRAAFAQTGGLDMVDVLQRAGAWLAKGLDRD